MTARLYLEIAAALVLCIGAGLFVHHERSIGAEHESAAVNSAVLAAQEAMQRDFDAKAKTVSTIGDHFNATVSVPVLDPPVVKWLRVPTVCADHVPQAPVTTGKTHADAASGAEDPPNPGPLLTTVGRDADAQVQALQDYITQVCLQ